MKTYSTPLVSCAVILCVVTGVASAAEPAATRPSGVLSNTRHASCLLKITYDPEALPLSIDMISRLLSAPGGTGAAFRDVFSDIKTDPDFMIEGIPAFEVSFKPVLAEGGVATSRPAGGAGRATPGAAVVSDESVARPGVLFGELTVTLYEGLPPRAQEYMTAICDRLRTVLAKASEGDRDYLAQQMLSETAEADAAEKQLAELFHDRLAMSLSARGGDVSRDNLLETSRQAENEKQKLKMELAGQEARRRAINEQIARIGDNVAKVVQEDPALRELNEAVRRLQAELKDAERRLAESEKRLAEVREKNPQSGEKRPEASAPGERERLQRQAQEHEVASQGIIVNQNKAFMNGIRQKIVEATLQLNQAREGVSRAHGGDILGKLNGELATLAIGTAETEARLRFAEEQVLKLKEALQQADAYEMKIAIELPLAQKVYETAKLRLTDLQRRLRAVSPPNVTVLGGR